MQMDGAHLMSDIHLSFTGLLLGGLSATTAGLLASVFTCRPTTFPFICRQRWTTFVMAFPIPGMSANFRL